MSRELGRVARAAAALRDIAGSSQCMRRLRSQVSAIAPLESTVLLTGETGSGKGNIAQVLHRMSPREALPFVHVDCAALSPTLIESELFGHEKGAFTGAAGRRIGRFETAGRGTVFLDEIGDLEPKLQAKLLRVLDAREFERIGGNQTRSMRARVLAATSRDLRPGLDGGRFRADLYFRLAVFHLSVPPLRERPEDIPALVSHGLRKLSQRLGRAIPEPTAGVHARLMQHDWPGNVRELMNVLERLAVQSSGNALEPAHAEGLIEPWPALPSAPAADPRASVQVAEAGSQPARDSRPLLPELRQQASEAERVEILAALERSGGNVTDAARQLHIPRSTLRHRIRKHALDGQAAADAPRVIPRAGP